MVQHSQKSDEALIELCNSGTRSEAAAAFDALYRRHRDFVLRVSLRLCSDREIAVDVMQETFLYLLKKFPPPGSGLKLTARLTSLLYPVARNLTLTALKKARKQSDDGAPGPDELPDPNPAPSDHADLERVLAGLPRERREVVWLRFVDGFTLAEIAAMLDVPLGTVKSRLHLAVQALKKSPIIKLLETS